MKPYLKHFFKQIYFLAFLFFFPLPYSYAYDGADPDTTFGLGSFNGTVRVARVQSDGKIVVGGDFTYYKNVPVNYIARLNPDGSLDNSFNIGSGANSSVYSMAIQTDGKILIGGYFGAFNGSTSGFIARLNINGSIDPSFIGSASNGMVSTITLQADGKILIGGTFNRFNGILKNQFARLNTDGSLDNAFTIDLGLNCSVDNIIMHTNEKILVQGRFINSTGTALVGRIRLNPDGSIDNSLNTDEPCFMYAVQPDGKILGGGGGLVVRLNSDGTLDNSFNVPGPNTNVSVKSLAIQGDGKIVIGGTFASYDPIGKNSLARLNNDGSIDNSFNIGGSGANSIINTVVLQSDGNIIAGGQFTSYNGISKNCLVRIFSDGSIDNSFTNVRGTNMSNIYSISIQKDRKIIVGGDFTTFNGIGKNYIARLNYDGTVDNSFNIGQGANNTVNITAVQTDGKIIVGGSFTSFNGNSLPRLARLNSVGSIDNTFNIGSGFLGGDVASVAIQNDGKIIAGGNFTSFNGTSMSHLIRLNSDGSIDNTFIIGSGANNTVSSLLIQSDGNILVGGDFTDFNGTALNRLVRLHSDGSIDNSFNIGSGAGGSGIYRGVESIVIQADGQLLVGGFFTSFNGFQRNGLVRLNPNGSVDNSLNIGSGVLGDQGNDGYVFSLVLQSDNKILIGGNFTTFNNTPAWMLARLNPDGSIDLSFNTTVGAFNGVRTIAMETKGKIIIAGSFEKYKSFAYNHIVRLMGEPDYSNIISGNIYNDANHDCTFQNSELPLSTVVVKALPGPYYGSSDMNGHYQVRVDSGAVAYTVSQQFNSVNSRLLVNQCASSHTASMNGKDKDSCCFNFADSVRACALLSIDIRNSRLRRCALNTTFVNYSNFGSQNASNAQIKIVYPSYVIPISSIPMWTSKQDSILIYDLGTVQKNFSASIVVTDSVICGIQEISGLTQCIKAIISPSSNCIQNNPSWDQSSTKVEGFCGDGIAHFFITNSGTGNMTDSLPYRIYENDTLIFIGNYKLNSNSSLEVNYMTNSQTIRLEADQHPLHPGNSRPRLTLEGCKSDLASPTSVRKGLVLTAPQDDLDEEVAISCNTIVDSYDPNEKQVFPLGFGSAHKVRAGEELEYIIHFQNTGTDTAYNVTVVDTLDVNLDVASFTKGISSHPFILNVSGKGKAVLTFNFNNINLPDSTKNKLKSNGLLSFRIKIPAGTVTGTEIKNKAYIYFDYNSPIITNETMHTVDDAVEKDLSKGTMVQVEQIISGIQNNKFMEAVKIYPNPSGGMITVEIPEVGINSEIKILSVLGTLQKSASLIKTINQVNFEGLKEGLYLYEIWQNGERKSGGKLVIR